MAPSVWERAHVGMDQVVAPRQQRGPLRNRAARTRQARSRARRLRAVAPVRAEQRPIPTPAPASPSISRTTAIGRHASRARHRMQDAHQLMFLRFVYLRNV